MQTRVLKIGLLAVIAAGVATVVVRQRNSTEALRNEISRLQQENSGRKAANASHAATQLAQREEELEQLRIAAAQSADTRREIAELERALAAATAKASTPSTLEPENSGAAPKAWTNAGTATPAAALETMLWSALNGDTDTLASLVAFEPAGRERIDALFARLPEAQRTASGSADKAFATLLAVRLPQDLSAADVLSSSETADGATLRLRLQHTGGRDKEANFRFSRTPAGWRLIVPNNVVYNYQQMLASAPGK